jgi:hypothetical protein
LDDDEILVMAVSAVVTLISAVRWYGRTLLGNSLNRPRAVGLLLFFTPPACLCILFVVLRFFADHVVRDSGGYICLFLLVGSVCLALAALFLPLTGISARDDAIERGNAAAAIVVCAAFLATTLCFAGANIGEGATIWTTIGPAALGLVGLFLSWLLVALLGGSTDAITIDRDFPSAIRRGGFFIATGLILAGALAGNFVSTGETWTSFLERGWPVLLLLVMASTFDRVLKLRCGPVGWLPALSYVFFALTDLWVVAGGKK